MSKQFRPTEILRILSAKNVDFIVVGGVAGTLAGSPVTTRDLDIVYSTAGENLERLVEVLQSIDACYRDPADRRILPDVEKLARIRVNLLETDHGYLDLLREIGDGWTFTHLLDRSIEYELGNRTFRAINVQTLIEAKTVAGRPKDLFALPFLHRLLEQENDGG